MKRRVETAVATLTVLMLALVSIPISRIIQGSYVAVPMPTSSTITYMMDSSKVLNMMATVKMVVMMTTVISL